VPATGSTRSAAIEAEPGAIVAEVTLPTDSTEEHSAACGHKQIPSPKSQITNRTDERRSFGACDSIPHLQAADRADLPFRASDFGFRMAYRFLMAGGPCQFAIS